MTEYVVVPKDVFERAGRWMSAALDCSTTCNQCKDDFATLFDVAKPKFLDDIRRDLLKELMDASS